MNISLNGLASGELEVDYFIHLDVCLIVGTRFFRYTSNPLVLERSQTSSKIVHLSTSLSLHLIGCDGQNINVAVYPTAV